MRKVLSDDEEEAGQKPEPKAEAKPAGTGLFGGLFGSGQVKKPEAVVRAAAPAAPAKALAFAAPKKVRLASDSVEGG